MNRTTKGARASWTGSLKNPQYHETSVNNNNDAANDTGNAYASKVFFSDGYSETCRNDMIQNQLPTEAICSSAIRVDPSSQTAY
jgi:hypothetical protein